MIRVDNIELKEKLRSKKKRVAEDLGISRQAFAQKLENPFRFRLTEINALIDLGYGECIYCMVAGIMWSGGYLVD